MRCSSWGRSASPAGSGLGRGRGPRPLRLCRQTIFGRPGSSRITIGREERQTQVPAPSSRARGRARKILDPAKGRRGVRASWILTLYARRASARRLPRSSPRATERSSPSVIAFLPSARSLTRPSLDQDAGRPLVGGARWRPAALRPDRARWQRTVPSSRYWAEPARHPEAPHGPVLRRRRTR